jgi:hypothetical protein
MTVMLSVLADGRTLPLFVTVKEKKCLKGYMTEELIIKYLMEVWGRSLGAFLNKRVMVVLWAFKGHIIKKNS